MLRFLALGAWKLHRCVKGSSYILRLEYSTCGVRSVDASCYSMSPSCYPT